MTTDFLQLERLSALSTEKPITNTNSFVGNECVFKSCCKKYKKGKRCKKCPDR